MHPLAKLPGPLLIATGAIHLGVFVALSADAAAAMLKAGIVNTVAGPDGTPLASRSALWYGGFWTAAVIVLLGLALLHQTRSTGQPAPRYLGWGLAGFSALACAVDPAPGAWLTLAIGLLIAFTPAAPASPSTP